MKLDLGVVPGRWRCLCLAGSAQQTKLKADCIDEPKYSSIA